VEDLEGESQFRRLPQLKPDEERLRLIGGDIIGIFEESFRSAFVEVNTVLKVSGTLEERGIPF